MDRSEIRTNDWYNETANKLTAYASCLIFLCAHPQWKVRLELVRGATLVLAKCSCFLGPTETTFVQVLISLSRDAMQKISDEAESILNTLLHPNSSRGYEIFETIEKDFIFLLDSVNSLLDSSDERTLLSQLNLLHGFVNILNLKQICKSSIYVRKLFVTLTKMVRLDASTMNTSFGHAALDAETRSYTICWRNTKYLSSRTEDVVKSILSAIGRKIDVENTTFFLLDALENRPDDRKELIYLVNNIIMTGVRECDEVHYKLMESVLNVYLDPAHWSAAICSRDNVDSVTSAVIHRSNLLQVCLLTEGIGSMAVCLRRKFIPLLIHCLYPVVEVAGSDNMFLSSVGMKTLEKMMNACGYSDLTEFITCNVDYVMHSVGIKLRNIEQNPGVFDVFCVIIAHSQKNSLPVICDVVHILLASDEIVHDNYCEGFLRVFQIFVRKLRYWFAASFNDFSWSSALDEKLFELLRCLDATYIEHKNRETYTARICVVEDKDVNLSDVFGEIGYNLANLDEDADGNVELNESGRRPAPSETTNDAMPEHVHLIILVARKIVQVLPYKTQRNKILILEILTEILLVLHDVKEDWLLPVVHDMWAPLKNRFRYDCAELVVFTRCFVLLCVMVATAKDFLRKRTLVDVLPMITEFLLLSSRESELKDRNSVYRMSQQYKLQRILLSHLGPLVVSVGLRENELHSLVTAVTPYLSSRQPFPLQANSRKKTPKKEEKGDIFIDGDELEGSGIGNIEANKNDLEFSGSGYGPDDEDSEPDSANTYVSGSKTRVGMTNISNVLRKIMTESNQDKFDKTLPMPTTSVSAVTTKAESPTVETDTKAQPVEPVNNEKEHGGIDASNTDKTPAEDISNNNNNGVYVVNTPDRDRTTSFFAQPGILAAVIGGAVVGLLCAILVVMFIVYRMRKKDEGSYPLEEMKRCPATNPYSKPNHREFFA